MATKIPIEPVFEADFKDCSYGFRPKFSAKQAFEVVRKACNNKGYGEGGLTTSNLLYWGLFKKK